MQMKYQFVKSSADVAMCPAPDKPEVALIGRSNVGKSSLINSLLGARSAAKTSATPGKTQLINHFVVNDAWYLVDLPGYGYARVSQAERARWEKMVRQYLARRQNLTILLVLIDSRIPPQGSDLEFLRFAGKNGIPIGLVFTKADKQSPGKTNAQVSLFLNEMKKDWEELPPWVVTSAVSGLGREDLIGLLQRALDAGQLS